MHPELPPTELDDMLKYVYAPCCGIVQPGCAQMKFMCRRSTRSVLEERLKQALSRRPWRLLIRQRRVSRINNKAPQISAVVSYSWRAVIGVGTRQLRRRLQVAHRMSVQVDLKSYVESGQNDQDAGKRASTGSESGLGNVDVDVVVDVASPCPPH